MIGYKQDYQFSEAHFRLAMQAANVGMWDWDVVRDRHILTEECKVMLDLRSDATISFEHFLSRIHPDDRGHVANLVSISLQTQTELVIEYRVIHSDGSLHWIAGRGRGVYDCDGKPV